jgi:S1-C subfamily serine protease
MNYKITILLVSIVFVALLIIPANYVGKITSENNVSESISSSFEVELASMSTVEVKTRNASVKIYSPDGSYGSGAYFLFKNHHIILTAAHVVGSGDIFLVIDRWNNERFGQVVYRDIEKDFAIILIPEFQKTKPLRLKLPQYDIKDRIGSEFVFSGYPARQALTTVRGRVAGFEGPYFVLHSAAWKGSSGSCLFDRSGNFVGILTAVTISSFDNSPVLIEDFVWVLPYSGINWEEAEEALESVN